MFKIAKYYFLLSLYQKTKRNILAIMLFTMLFLVSSYIFTDLIAMAEEKLGLVLAKWTVILILLAVIAFNVSQIYKALPTLFKQKEKAQRVDSKKEKIISKERLLSRSDMIINKYRAKA